MDPKTKDFLKGLLLPEYAILLLELYGVGQIQDLKEFGEDDIETIEEIRIKYLGIDFSDLADFSFRILDKKKLRTISAAAHQIALAR